MPTERRAPRKPNSLRLPSTKARPERASEAEAGAAAGEAESELNPPSDSFSGRARLMALPLILTSAPSPPEKERFPAERATSSIAKSIAPPSQKLMRPFDTDIEVISRLASSSSESSSAKALLRIRPLIRPDDGGSGD